ncbi:hypothetical protein THAOC_14364, partial [Thalassiosira oceanica]
RAQQQLIHRPSVGLDTSQKAELIGPPPIDAEALCRLRPTDDKTSPVHKPRQPTLVSTMAAHRRRSSIWAIPSRPLALRRAPLTGLFPRICLPQPPHPSPLASLAPPPLATRPAGGGFVAFISRPLATI